VIGVAVEVLKDNYPGKIREVTLGAADVKKVGGDSALPFHLFEGEGANPVMIALDVEDCPPAGWPDTVLEPYMDVVSDPVLWAKRCIEEYGADSVCLQLTSTDPNGMNRSADEAADVVKRVCDEIAAPLIVLGTGNVEKDQEVLKKVAEICEGRNLLIGPAKEENYKTIGASAIGYKHSVLASTPMDVNLAKQLNVLLTNLGLPPERIVIDPATGALGYGLEYSYSVIERDRIAALCQNDDMMQMPILCNLGREVWRVKEVRMKDEGFGDEKTRGILWEGITAISLALAGANILIMRHPRAMDLVRGAIQELMG
jgi:acetyl-CoA decarbonylase/synthase complex subunit delta